MIDEPDEDSCLTRQLNECTLLKSMYGDELALLSKKGEPLEYVLHLQGDNSSIDLHIKCPEDYPHIAPFIQLKNWKKIPNDCIAILKDELLDLADSFKGEVLIHELALHCENGLYRFAIPETCSLYEGMMQRNRDLEEIKARELQRKRADELRKREEIVSHIQSQQQALRKALRRKSKSETVAEINEKIVLDYRRSSMSPENSPKSSQMPHQSTAEGGDPWDLCTHSTSRFENDFEQIQKLGEGAYGEVVKVRNRLDGKYYAIKKIKLNPSLKLLNKKITREVQLLSCLNHENVVRYYNSWVEIANPENIESNSDPTEDDVSSTFKEYKKDAFNILPCGQEMTMDWSEPKPTNDEDSDSFLVFGDPSEQVSEESISSKSSDKSNVTIKPIKYMYIQMELCEKSTLRIAIDNGLHKNGDRVWRLFREIVEGLCHIHHQGIMHRDLKPVNIFLGSNDQVKIGDFGLAKTSKPQKTVALQPCDTTDSSESSKHAWSHSSARDVSATGPVGTALYVAPELDGGQPKTYNQKVDVYSLGIIFFEMHYHPFSTHMEKYETIMKLRTPNIKFPEDFPYSEHSNEYKLIRMMLSHDIDDRPTSQDILASECLGAVKLDEGDVKDMVKRTLSNPQSKDYKFLIASCFNQSMSPAFEATYNMSTFRNLWSTVNLNIVQERIRIIFQHYGALTFAPPLFTPGQAPKNGVCLMTSIGGIVHATPDLQMPFARYVVQNPSVVTFKRYALEKVYKEMPVGIHPREVYECAFDIVSSCFGDLMPDIELLAVVRDILKSFPQLLRRNSVLYLNHSVFISVLLDICSTNSSTSLKKTDWQNAIVRAMAECTSKTELRRNLLALNVSESAVTIISDWMDAEGGPEEISALVETTVKNTEWLPKCNSAIKQLQRIKKDCGLLKMVCPIVIKPSLVRNPCRYTGIIFQVECDNRIKGKTNERCAIISGGRYDGLLEELKQKIPSDTSKPVRYITGFTMNIEMLVNSIDDDGRSALVDVLFCSRGPSAMTPDRMTLMKELWGLNLKVYFSNTLQTMDEIQSLCELLGVTVLLLVKANDPGFVRVRILNKDSKGNEKKLNYNEVVDYLTKTFKQEATPLNRNVMNLPIISFISIDKIAIKNMKIYESQIEENMSAIIQSFSPNVKVEVLALPVKGEVIKTISSSIELDDVTKSMDTACKKYPNMKRLMLKTAKHIEDSRGAHPTTVIILYGLFDNSYKVLM